jgi:hypothetical protein
MKKRTRKLLKALMQEIIELRARVRVLEGWLRNLKIASVSSVPRRPGQGSRVAMPRRDHFLECCLRMKPKLMQHPPAAFRF